MSSTKSGAFILGLALLASAAGSLAQPAGGQTTRIILPAPTGGTFVVGTFLSQQLRHALGAVIIENRPGAGGVIAMQEVLRSAPDGRTLLLGSPSLSILPFAGRKLPLDPINDFTPVSLVAAAHNAILVHPSVPVKSVKELVALARAQPGKLTYGSTLVGSNRMAVELFKVLAGVDVRHIPYKSGTNAMTDLVGGQIDLVIGGLTSAVPLISAGRLKGVAVLAETRNPALPEMPTIVEQGMPDLLVKSWYGILVSKATAPDIVQMLSREIIRIMGTSEAQAYMQKHSLELLSTTPAEFARFIADEADKWKRVVQQGKLRFE